MIDFAAAEAAELSRRKEIEQGRDDRLQSLVGRTIASVQRDWQGDVQIVLDDGTVVEFNGSYGPQLDWEIVR